MPDNASVELLLIPVVLVNVTLDSAHQRLQFVSFQQQLFVSNSDTCNIKWWLK